MDETVASAASQTYADVEHIEMLIFLTMGAPRSGSYNDSYRLQAEPPTLGEATGQMVAQVHNCAHFGALHGSFGVPF